MAKKPRRTKKEQGSRETNWLVVGGVVILGAIALFALLYFALREPETQTLAEYCQKADGKCIVEGDDNAPVTLIEVSDFGCVHCRAFHQTTAEIIQEQYVDQGLVKWVSVPYALSATTAPSANAAFCANDQGKYFKFRQALFNMEPVEVAITRDGFLAAGEEVGLDMDTFTQCLADGTHNNDVSTNQAAASQAGVNSTPTFFINDQIIRGNVPLEQFQSRFDEIINS
ncbi:MAG: DsbA family protein [Candidatus Promineifilaceae bacterium]|jgi:protein-disulfide isomerase